MNRLPPILLAGALALAACQSTPPPRPLSLPRSVTGGPFTAFPDVELFGENPLQAFQRSGAQPLPLASLPEGTSLRILAQSGAFYQVATPSNQVGWVAARSVAGASGQVPEFSATQTGPTPVPGSADSTPGMPVNEPDTIDLDRMP
jgi:hypothetical protein